jgi:L-malate glycosyltransferase
MLRELMDSPVFKPYNLYLLTNSGIGFLSGSSAKRIVVPYAYFQRKILTLIAYTLYSIYVFFALTVLLLILKSRGQNITVVVNTILPWSAALAGKIFSCRVVFSSHETYLKPKPLKRFLRFIVEYTASDVIFVSRYLSLTEKYVKPKQHVVYNCIGKKDKPSGANLKERFLKGNILFVGSLKKYKGVNTLVRLAALLGNYSFHMVLNADKCEYNFYFSNETPPSNLEVYFRPKNLPEIYNSAALCLNLTNPKQCVESFGMTILEAMSHSCPVIAPPFGGPIELLEGGGGLLVDPTDVKLLAREIEKLFSHYDTWIDLAGCAYKRSLIFDRDGYQKSIATILESVS